MIKEIKKLRPLPAPGYAPLLPPKFVLRTDRCINCGQCIRSCTYDCHERSSEDPRIMADPDKGSCRACFACILDCPRGALEMIENDEYATMNDLTYPPLLMRTIQEQAASGKIPVSGAGYGGRFDGEGFDGLWTDMSEIVRPTRDGIHGREAISTVVDLGRKVPDLCGMEFDSQGNMISLIPPTREIAIPVMFGSLPFAPPVDILTPLAIAARALSTYQTVRLDEDPERLREYFNHLIIRMAASDLERSGHVIEWATIVEFDPDDRVQFTIRKAREINPHLLTTVRVPVGPGATEEILRLSEVGAETLHLYADWHGQGDGGTNLFDCLRACHQSLVERGLRDQITLLASGGIARAEHVPKAIILGADAVVIDVPLLIALECTVCDTCRNGATCPRNVGEQDSAWSATRVINLMLSWRDQLLEVLGAMGLRDVRRLRGETGRAVFADEVRESFISLLEQGRQERTTREDAASPIVPVQLPWLEEKLRAPGRFPTNLSQYTVVIDRSLCTDCGLCAETCPHGVYHRTDGKIHLDEPVHEQCIGPSCLDNDWCCVHVCPWKAIEVEKSNLDVVLGDFRWTASLLKETWRQARTGDLPSEDKHSQTGRSDGGFDVVSLGKPPPSRPVSPETVDLSIALNKRAKGPKIDIPIPIYGGGMSYGSISLEVMLGRAMAAQTIGSFTSTGEGGYPDELIPYADHVITQIATGLFGVREETISRARLVEFKYAQGAKPGLGGHLLEEKNTERVAAMREAVPGTGLFSPFPFHSVYSVEDHKKHLDWVRSIRQDLLVSVKVSTPADVDMVAVGAYYAGANIIHIDGGYGGTGAAPDIAKKNIAQPIEYAIVQVHDFLLKEGIRDQVTVMASGGIRTPDDVLKAIALGADGVVIGTAELVAIDCVRCTNCERDRGCPIGIATTDPELSPRLTPEWVHDRLVTMYQGWTKYFRESLSRIGLNSIRELCGRRDVLSYMVDE